MNLVKRALEKLRKLVKYYLKCSWTINYTSDEFDAIVKALRKALHRIPVQLNIDIQHIGGVSYQVIFIDLNLKAIVTVSQIPERLTMHPVMRESQGSKYVVTFINCRELRTSF